MDDESLIEILSGRHLSMPERIKRGVWPHPPLEFKAIVDHLAGVVRERVWFPRPFVPSKPGEPVADATAIERRSDSEYLVHIQRSGASGYTVAERGTRVFTRAEDAAAFFLEAEFHLPGDLDGWKVMR